MLERNRWRMNHVAITLGLVFVSACSDSAPSNDASMPPGGESPDPYPFTTSVDDSADTVVHVGNLLGQTPIDTDGSRVEVSENGFFRDGERMRFWGINLVGSQCFPTHADADRMAERLAKLGINSARLHWMDYMAGSFSFSAPVPNPTPTANNIWLYEGDTPTTTVDPAQLERLHYLVNALAANGIHSNINLLNGWQFNLNVEDFLPPDPPDGTSDPDALRFYREFYAWPQRSRYIIVWHAEARRHLLNYAETILTEPNPHRDNIPLGQDPAVVMVETINENNLLGGWNSNALWREYAGARENAEFRIGWEWLKSLYQEWKAFLQLRYGTNSALAMAWGTLDAGDTIEGEVNADLESTPDLKTPQDLRGDQPRLLDTLEFLFEVESRFYREVNERLRTSYGVLSHISGSQFVGVGTPTLATRHDFREGLALRGSEQRANDYSNTHGYWNHYDEVDGGQFEVSQQALFPVADGIENGTRLPMRGEQHISPLPEFAANKIRGIPLVISEWNVSYPSPQMYQLPLMVAVYGAFQDWDGLDQFTFGLEIEDLDAPVQNEPHKAAQNPMMNVLAPILGLVYRRGDIRPAQHIVIAHHADPQDANFLQDAATAAGELYGGARIDGAEIPHWIPFVHRVERQFGGTPSASAAIPTLTENQVYYSDNDPENGQILLDLSNPERAYMRVDAPRTQIVGGYLSQHSEPVQLSRLSVDSRTDAAFVLTSLSNDTDHDLNTTTNAILVAYSDHHATDLISNLNPSDGDAIITDWGEAPNLVARVDATIRIASSSLASAQVYPLAADGSRLDPITSSQDGGDLVFSTGSSQSPWFEIATE